MNRKSFLKRMAGLIALPYAVKTIDMSQPTTPEPKPMTLADFEKAKTTEAEYPSHQDIFGSKYEYEAVEYSEELDTIDVSDSISGDVEYVTGKRTYEFTIYYTEFVHNQLERAMMKNKVQKIHLGTIAGIKVLKGIITSMQTVSRGYKAKA